MESVCGWVCCMMFDPGRRRHVAPTAEWPQAHIRQEVTRDRVAAGTVAYAPCGHQLTVA